MFKANLKKNPMKFYPLVTILLILGCTKVVASDPAIQVKKIWDFAPHNAFTDLINFKNKFYCTFREASGHVPGLSGTNGKIRVLVSTDGEKWESFALLEKEGYDLRDSKLSITPGKKLMVLMGGSAYNGNILLGRLTHVSFLSESKNAFSKPVPVKIDKKIKSGFDWLWRVTWFNGKGYGVIYQKKDKISSRAFLVSTKNGTDYSLITELQVGGIPNESSILVKQDREMVIVVRREGGNLNGYLGHSVPPYKTWVWKDLGLRLGGPDIVPSINNTYLIGTRIFKSEGMRTALIQADKTGLLKQVLELPRGGDNSYPGMITYNDSMWVSYYSSHEGKTQIYLAKIPMDYLSKMVAGN
jgi:hypothetical protein